MGFEAFIGHGEALRNRISSSSIAIAIAAEFTRPHPSCCRAPSLRSLIMKMQLALLLACVAAVAAFNITEELKDKPNYSEFNDILTKSGLAGQINSRSSITVGVLSNEQIDRLRGNLQQKADPEKELAKIVGVQIFLTFIKPDDSTKNSINGSQQMTSLYQTTGKAPGQDGIANLTVTKSGDLAIVMSDSNATITKSIKQIGYNLSIVEISNPLEPASIQGLAPSPSPPPSEVPVPAPTPIAPTPAAVGTPSATPDASSPATAAEDNKDNGAAGAKHSSMALLAAAAAAALLL